MSDFFRFPHTPHIAWLGKGQPRDDKVLAVDEANQFLGEAVVLEEKVDGANLGLSVGTNGIVRAQNRGQYLQMPYTGQFSRLNAWLASHESALLDALGDKLILFGEWVAATHSIAYTNLPDFFVVFDVYDRCQGRFWSTARRNALAERLGLTTIRTLGAGHFLLADLKRRVLESSSAYCSESCEGFYLRREDADWLIARAKIVHPDFAQGITEHWRSRALRWNSVGQTAAPATAVPGARQGICRLVSEDSLHKAGDSSHKDFDSLHKDAVAVPGSEKPTGPGLSRGRR